MKHVSGDTCKKTPFFSKGMLSLKLDTMRCYHVLRLLVTQAWLDASGTLRIQGKQNPLFPLWPVIKTKCLILMSSLLGLSLPPLLVNSLSSQDVCCYYQQRLNLLTWNDVNV